MKAIDLMVGNYVTVYPSNMLIKVAAVHNKKVGYTANGKLIWVRENLLRPIPLSRVHVTKNGFKATDKTDRIFVYKGGYELRVFFDEGIPEMEIEPFRSLFIGFAEKELWMDVKYLHTLQQALKLFEVDKEIVL
jgi:hypothetical protein